MKRGSGTTILEHMCEAEQPSWRKITSSWAQGAKTMSASPSDWHVALSARERRIRSLRSRCMAPPRGRKPVRSERILHVWRGSIKKPSGKTLQKHPSSFWKVALQRGNSLRPRVLVVCRKAPFNSSDGEVQLVTVRAIRWCLLGSDTFGYIFDNKPLICKCREPFFRIRDGVEESLGKLAILKVYLM